MNRIIQVDSDGPILIKSGDCYALILYIYIYIYICIYIYIFNSMLNNIYVCRETLADLYSSRVATATR